MQNITFYLLAAGMLLTNAAHTQTTEKELKREVIIEQKRNGKKEKMVIEIEGDEVRINGKPADEYEGKERIVIGDDLIIDGNRVILNGRSNRVRVAGVGSNKALLGVITQNNENGALIESVSKGSGAEKAGLLKGDIITGIEKNNVSSPDDLTKAIAKQKPADEVEVSYLRAGKKGKVKAVLGKATNSMNWNDNNVYNYRYDSPRAFTLPRIEGLNLPRIESHNGDVFFYSTARPKYGMSVQDDEEGRGVVVTEVETDGAAAKGGLKKDDIITEIDGKAIKNVDQVRDIMESTREKMTIEVKILRNSNTETLTIRVPRKLKTANL